MDHWLCLSFFLTPVCCGYAHSQWGPTDYYSPSALRGAEEPHRVIGRGRRFHRFCEGASLFSNLKSSFLKWGAHEVTALGFKLSPLLTAPFVFCHSTKGRPPVCSYLFKLTVFGITVWSWKSRSYTNIFRAELLHVPLPLHFPCSSFQLEQRTRDRGHGLSVVAHQPDGGCETGRVCWCEAPEHTPWFCVLIASNLFQFSFLHYTEFELFIKLLTFRMGKKFCSNTWATATTVQRLHPVTFKLSLTRLQ